MVMSQHGVFGASQQLEVTYLANSWSSHTGMSGAEARMALVSTSLLYWLYRVLQAAYKWSA